MFSQDNSCPDLLVASLVPQQSFRVRGYHPLLPDFPDRSAITPSSLGLIPGRSPLLWESQLISFPPGT